MVDEEEEEVVVVLVVLVSDKCPGAQVLRYSKRERE
jgi:hypothetical protein